MKPILVIASFFITTVIIGQVYQAGLLPDSLKINAHAVKRMEELRVTIKSTDRVIVKHKYAITILDEQGDANAGYSNSYSTLEKLSDISGTLYDASGKKIKSVKRRDIADEPVSDGFSLMRDDRIKHHDFYYKEYPYTIEYEDEQEYKGTYFLPRWMPFDNDFSAVEQSRLVVETPLNYELRYKALNLDQQPAITDGPVKTYVWEIRNQKALTKEIFQPDFNSLTPTVYIGPAAFSFGGYTGNMSNWLEFGKFQTTLNKDRDVLPDQVKLMVHELTNELSATTEKAKKLYEYLQQNTRYVSIQLGIGGWQPFDARYVATNKYGDCKALSNYMVSLLKEAGIKSYYVLVTAGAGKKGVMEDFPSPHFNHVITCVPDGKDTLWLECTSQTNPAGYMGSFTGNRTALLVADDGGHVVRTPVYTAEDNLQLRNIKAVIDEEGNLTASVSTRFTGEQQELQHSLIHHATAEQREKYLNAALNLPTYKVEKSEYKEIKSKTPVVDEFLQITATGYASISGKRLFIEPNLFNKSQTRLTPDGSRKYPIEFTMAFTDVDTISISIPSGYQPESIPKNTSIHTPFAAYSIEFKVNGNVIEVLRRQVRIAGVYPKEEYNSLVNYFNTITKEDRSRIVFVKKEG